MTTDFDTTVPAIEHATVLRALAEVSQRASTWQSMYTTSENVSRMGYEERDSARAEVARLRSVLHDIAWMYADTASDIRDVARKALDTTSTQE